MLFGGLALIFSNFCAGDGGPATPAEGGADDWGPEAAEAPAEGGADDWGPEAAEAASAAAEPAPAPAPPAAAAAPAAAEDAAWPVPAPAAAAAAARAGAAARRPRGAAPLIRPPRAAPFPSLPSSPAEAAPRGQGAARARGAPPPAAALRNLQPGHQICSDADFHRCTHTTRRGGGDLGGFRAGRCFRAPLRDLGWSTPARSEVARGLGLGRADDALGRAAALDGAGGLARDARRARLDDKLALDGVVLHEAFDTLLVDRAAAGSRGGR
jgi:hypothetical protein